MGRHRHFYGLNHLHYVTTSTYRRARLFDSERFKLQFITTLAGLRVELGLPIVGYLLMRIGVWPRSFLATRHLSLAATWVAAAGRRFNDLTL